ncbi:MAG: hypothetical protein LBP40_04730 [Campylobacteraceae bacterium]|jgi:hypothetical protein|nr:hypothetical protein [Campylobacteraceae bacterium]
MAGNINSGRKRDNGKLRIVKSFRINESTFDKISEMSKKFNVSDSKLIEMAIEAYCEVISFIESGLKKEE